MVYEVSYLFPVSVLSEEDRTRSLPTSGGRGRFHYYSPRRRGLGKGSVGATVMGSMRQAFLALPRAILDLPDAVKPDEAGLTKPVPS